MHIALPTICKQEEMNEWLQHYKELGYLVMYKIVLTIWLVEVILQTSAINDKWLKNIDFINVIL
jgi:hypothetical protein